MRLLGLSALCLTAASLFAQTTKDFAFDWGYNFRLRAVATNNMPMPDHWEEPRAEYARFRSKLWGEVKNEDYEFYARLGHEPFYFQKPEGVKGFRRAPDIVFIDNLYFKANGLLDGKVDVKVGRQDILDLTSMRLLLEGTPGDGSRSLYFDALRFTLYPTASKDRTLDFLAIYNANEDWLPDVGSPHAAPKPHKSADYSRNGKDQDEWALILYYKDRADKNFGFDLYSIFKGEEREGPNCLFSADRDHFYTQTFGFRLLPRITETITGEIEAAVQIGNENHLAAMAYSGLTWAPKETLFNPQFTLACLYLSGDSEGATGKHAWRSIFNRATFIGDVPGGMYDGYDHTNLLYPHLTIAITPAQYMTLSTQFGPMYAPAAEDRAMGGKYGHYRGFFANINYTVEVGQYFESEWMKPFVVSFLAEFMTKGGWAEDHDDQGLGFYGQFDVYYSF